MAISGLLGLDERAVQAELPSGVGGRERGPSGSQNGIDGGDGTLHGRGDIEGHQFPKDDGFGQHVLTRAQVSAIAGRVRRAVHAGQSHRRKQEASRNLHVEIAARDMQLEIGVPQRVEERGGHGVQVGAAGVRHDETHRQLLHDEGLAAGELARVAQVGFLTGLGARTVGTGNGGCEEAILLRHRRGEEQGVIEDMVLEFIGIPVGTLEQLRQIRCAFFVDKVGHGFSPQPDFAGLVGWVKKIGFGYLDPFGPRTWKNFAGFSRKTYPAEDIKASERDISSSRAGRILVRCWND